MLCRMPLTPSENTATPSEQCSKEAWSETSPGTKLPHNTRQSLGGQRWMRLTVSRLALSQAASEGLARGQYQL